MWKSFNLESKKNTYCSVECSSLDKKEDKINKWLNGEYDGVVGNNRLSKTIRNYLLEINNYSCELCGWNKINPTTGTCPLDIHHKDGNCLNNSKENLQVLCPNCHSLTDNYKALNKTVIEKNELLQGKIIV